MTYGYPQQPGGYPQQQGGYPGGYGPPPRKSRTGLVAAVAGLLAVVLTLVITGFVAPGFFLGDDDEDGQAAQGAGAASSTSKQAITMGWTHTPSAEATATSTGSGEPSGAGNILIGQFVDHVNAREVDAASALYCPEVNNGREQVDQLIGYGAQLVPEFGGDSDAATLAIVNISGTGNGTTATGQITAKESSDGASFCIISLRIRFR